MPGFLAGRAFRCIGMPFGKPGMYAAKSLPHPRYRGRSSSVSMNIIRIDCKALPDSGLCRNDEYLKPHKSASRPGDCSNRVRRPVLNAVECMP